MIRCDSCGHGNAEEQVFCSGCGARLREANAAAHGGRAVGADHPREPSTLNGHEWTDNVINRSVIDASRHGVTPRIVSVLVVVVAGVTAAAAYLGWWTGTAGVVGEREAAAVVAPAEDQIAGADQVHSPTGIANQDPGHHLDQGDLCVEQGDYEAAVVAYTEAIRLAPEWASAYFGRGVARQELGLYAAALPDFAKAVEFDPTWAAAYARRAQSYLETGDNAAAIQDCTAAIGLDNGLSVAVITRAQAYIRNGDERSAIADLTTVIEACPDPVLYGLRALCYLSLDLPDEALGDISTAIGLDPNDPELYLDRALIYSELGEYASAAADERIARQLEAAAQSQ